VRATAFVELWAEIAGKGLVFGRGQNPINFVSVHDVAAAVERAATDDGLRGRVLEIGGPDNLTFNDLAALLGRSHVRHIPRWLLRGASPLSRRARAALAMDTIDMSFDASQLPMTDLETALGVRVLAP
jgi:uncharacterized protein YbjT (DUF2867 family)